MEFVTISASARPPSRSFLNARPATAGVGSLCLRQLIGNWRIERGFPDPGNLCPTCAALNERVIEFDEAC
jgi:hypothetical protein